MAAIPHPLLLPQHLNVLLLYWIQISWLPVRNFNFRLKKNTESLQNLPFVYHNSVRLPQFQKVYHGSMIDPENIIFHIQKISQKISGILENSTFLYEIEQFFKIGRFFEWENDIILLMNMQLIHSMRLLWHVLVDCDHVLQYHLETKDHRGRIVVGMKYQDHLLKKVSVEGAKKNSRTLFILTGAEYSKM